MKMEGFSQLILVNTYCIAFAASCRFGPCFTEVTLNGPIGLGP